MPMPGLRDQWVEVYSQTQSGGEYGGVTTTRNALGGVWARVVPDARPKEDTIANVQSNINQVVFDIDYLDGEFYALGNQHSLYWRGLHHDVLGTSMIGRQDGMRVFTEAIQNLS